MEPEYLWSLSPREYNALRKVYEQSRDHTTSMYASLQATLHNAWFQGRKFTAADFMPGLAQGGNPLRSQSAADQKMMIEAMFAQGGIALVKE